MNRLVNDSRKCEILLFKISIIVVSVIVLVMSIVGAYYFKNCLWDKESLNLTLTLQFLLLSLVFQMINQAIFLEYLQMKL